MPSRNCEYRRLKIEEVPLFQGDEPLEEDAKLQQCFVFLALQANSVSFGQLELQVTVPGSSFFFNCTVEHSSSLDMYALFVMSHKAGFQLGNKLAGTSLSRRGEI